ncbi:MAG TPA: MerR family transcriptional regulator [Nitrospirales bacterium]|nr:MerR family transcriptional regulator [Nitrospirales bacterium]
MAEHPQIKKLFYKIGEVSAMTQVPTYVLRFWESEFKFLKPGKGRGRRRTYVERDIETVRTIKRLLYDEGHTLEGVRRQWGKTSRAEREASANARLPGEVLEHVKAQLNEALKIIGSYDGESQPKRKKKPSGSGRSAAR